jgi:hypothetical protein
VGGSHTTIGLLYFTNISEITRSNGRSGVSSFSNSLSSILHNEEIRDMYSSLSIITIIKSRRMRWAGLVARMGKMRNAYRLLVGKPERKSTKKTNT